MDDKLRTPYSHVFDLSITRDLGHNFVFEATYIGRLGRRLLQEEDLAMPFNLSRSEVKDGLFCRRHDAHESCQRWH